MIDFEQARRTLARTRPGRRSLEARFEAVTLPANENKLLELARDGRFFDPRSSDADGRDMVTEERAELRGTTLEGRYELGACIGVGGTGVVFEATRLVDRAQVVVKTLRPVFAYNADLARRLRREAEVARRVKHPGIVPVFDEGALPDGSPYIVLERMRSESLSRLLRRSGTLGVTETCAIAVRVAAILHRSHSYGYVHRDVKPEHVLLDRAQDGSLLVSLLDFGVCAAETAPSEEKNRERGRVFGTPSYVSPEQACGNPDVDGRADIFSLGIVMYECLTGRLPFSGSTVTALLRRIIKEDAPRVMLCAPHVDRVLDEVVAKSMARIADHRFPSARAFGRAVAPFLSGRLAIERGLASRLCVGDQQPDTTRTVRHEFAAA